jgi:transcriptional regulator GlxA family with amidase domain
LENGPVSESIEWIGRMHDGGAILLGLSGLFLLETGLFDGRDSTVHYNAAEILPPRIRPSPFTPSDC